MDKKAQRPTMWSISKGWLPQAIQEKVKKSPGAAIPGLGYMAWKSGARTPLSAASRDLFESLPGSARHVDASRWLSEQVHPESAFGEFQRVFGPNLDDYVSYGRQLTYSHPGTKYWRELAPTTWAARQSQRRPMGLGPGFAVPPAVWQQGRQQAQRKMFAEPKKMQQAVRMGREPIYQSPWQYLQQALRGRGGVDFKKLLNAVLGNIGLDLNS